MITNAKQMACGACGHGKFNIYHDPSLHTGGMRGEFVLYVECASCKAVTSIRPSQPRIEIDWAEGNDKGILCPMEPSS